MDTVSVEMPRELLRQSGWRETDYGAEAAAIVALEMFRQGTVSLARAAELCGQPLQSFLQFAAAHKVPMNYSSDDLEEDRRTLARLGL